MEKVTAHSLTEGTQAIEWNDQQLAVEKDAQARAIIEHSKSRNSIISQWTSNSSAASRNGRMPWRISSSDRATLSSLASNGAPRFGGVGQRIRQDVRRFMKVFLMCWTGRELDVVAAPSSLCRTDTDTEIGQGLIPDHIAGHDNGPVCSEIAKCWTAPRALYARLFLRAVHHVAKLKEQAAARSPWPSS